MKTEDLKRGVSIIWEMEKNNYLMTAAIRKLNYRINQLGKSKNITPPVKPKVKIDVDDDNGPFFLGLFIFLGVIAAIGLIVLLDAIGKEPGIIAGFFEFIFTVVAFFFLGCFVAKRDDKKMRRKAEEEINAAHQVALKKYAQIIENDKARVARELYEQKILIAERDSIKKKLDESIQLTRNLYSKLDIDYDYRNIIPIGYMEEFLRLGIATQLEGLNGLYALVRQELRADQMQYSLDQINQKIDQIIDNQSSIYSAISSVGTQCNTIVQQCEKSAKLAAQNNSALEETVNNSRITAYESERTRKEIEFRNFVDLALR